MSKSIPIELSLDGNQWCCLVGENLQEGVAFFADTPYEAIRGLTKSGGAELDLWLNKNTP